MPTEREMASMQLRVPALRSSGGKASTIRQHYYPEGGWGWVVCACAFLVHCLVLGFQLSYGVLLAQVLQVWGQQSYMHAVWLGSLNICVSQLIAPAIVGVCRRKSPRLTAVLGGLVVSLACLFSSFAQELHQVFISYGLVLGVGIGLTRETSGLVVAQYFKRRREMVEMLVMSGTGVGAAAIPALLRLCLIGLNWRLSLQIMAAVMTSTFFLAMFYRPASLYHPQRRAILHLKNQKRKIKEKKDVKAASQSVEKDPLVDWYVLKARTVQLLVLQSSLSGAAIYTPIILMAVQSSADGLDGDAVGRVLVYLGGGMVVGNMLCGIIVLRHSNECWISRQYLCQISLLALALSAVLLATVRGYNGYAAICWIYGISFGAHLYISKMYAYHTVRARNFARVWGFVQAGSSLGCLLGVPITGYLNQMEGRLGFYFSGGCLLVSCLLLFPLRLHQHRQQHQQHHRHHRGGRRSQEALLSSGRSAAGSISSRGLHKLEEEVEVEQQDPPMAICTCSPSVQEPPTLRPRENRNISFANSVEVLNPDAILPDDASSVYDEQAIIDQLYGSMCPGDVEFVFNQDPEEGGGPDECPYHPRSAPAQRSGHKHIWPHAANLAAGFSVSLPEGLNQAFEADHISPTRPAVMDTSL